MANKVEYLTNLANEITKQITSNENEWTGFLNISAWLYKYPYQEQILIYAQKPDATACASIEVWNNRLNRWVNQGAKGIALFDETMPYNKIKYVFDVEDTHAKYGKDDFEFW